MTYDIVEGTSTILQFQLLESGAAISLSGITVTLLLEDRIGNAVSVSGTVAVSDAANGKVQFTPTSTATFVATAGPYYARWVLTNALGGVSYVPSTSRDVWNIIGK